MKTEVIKSDSIATPTDDPDLTLDGRLPHQCEAILANGRRCRLRQVSEDDRGHWFCRWHRAPAKRVLAQKHGWQDAVWAFLSKLEELEPAALRRALADPECQRLADILLDGTPYAAN